jgi:N,N-dimethylformamidase
MKLAPDFGITGYTDRWTYRPGDAVSLHLSAASETSAAVRLHRFRRLVQDDAALELVSEEVAMPPLPVTVTPQRTVIGSWFEAPPETIGNGSFTIGFLVRPTRIAAAGSSLCGWTNGRSGFVVDLSPGGTVSLECRSGSGEKARLRIDNGLVGGRWAALLISYDRSSGTMSIHCRSGQRIRSASGAVPERLSGAGAVLRIGAAGSDFDAALPSFDGRIESPAVWRGALAPSDAFARLDRLADGDTNADEDLLAAWDFSGEMASATAFDIGPHGRHGRFVNLPTRAVKGSRWDGQEQSWFHAPRGYAATHFHCDDLLDAGWPPAGTLVLPEDLASGIYLIEIAGEQGRDTLPIFVTPRRRGESASLAWLASTFTYLAYANDRCLLHGANPEVLANRLIVLTANDCELAGHYEYGLSLYDTHMDGSGVSYSSRRRPCLTFRHNQRAWQGGLGSGLWNFGADLLVASWLDREGIPFEIITDDVLDAEGAEALSPYRCVLTGSHPEYHTTRSHDAVGQYLGNGGRLLYLGGNGFYWRVSTHPDFPETIELRRAEDGNRSWASEPGEYYHAFDGSYGGLWRRNGRFPQALVGVGYIGQGFFRSHPYRLQAAACDPRVAFLFDDQPVPGASLGDFGLSGGGAAGIEIDRADTALGTPGHALVIATTDTLDSSYVLANEEVLVNRPTVTGGLSPMLRTDLVFFETEAGGAVLSTGSVAWAGSLGDSRAKNEVAALTKNALRRFLDPTPFSQNPVSTNTSRNPGVFS